jgi:hypothetical protein
LGAALILSTATYQPCHNSDCGEQVLGSKSPARPMRLHFLTGPTAEIFGLFTRCIMGALKDADFLKLRDRGYLPLIYAHHASLASLDRLRETVLN